MGKWDLSDIYALALGPQARGRGHIRQIPIAHVISNMHLSIYHVRQIKKLNPQLKLYSLVRLQIHLLNCI